MTDFRLCYIEGNFAYFTSLPLDKQWGDDWNDAPYEHNAGMPYAHQSGDNPPHEIVRVAFEVNMETPADRAYGNSHYSVEQINRGDVAWLAGNGDPIYGGVTIPEFEALIWANGGNVYQIKAKELSK